MKSITCNIDFSLHWADTLLILSQRNAEWCGHGPILEQDIAITNVSLDMLGQSRSFYQYAASLIGGDATEDSLAYLRKERDFKNLLLAEQSNGDWSQTILRQFFFSQFQQLFFPLIQNGRDAQLAAIAEKSMKEIAYHVRWSSEWVIRMGDGTDESHARMIQSVNELWRYTGEMFMPAEYERDCGYDVSLIKDKWLEKVTAIFTEAGLTLPEKTFMQSGGKNGKHTEQLGYILTELQYLQRTYPGATW